MAKGQILQTNFASGVLDARAFGRVDIEIYNKGLAESNNLLTIPLGGIKRRPGLSYIDTLPNQLVEQSFTPSMPEGGTPSQINDYDYSTGTETTTDITTIDPYVVAQYDFGTAEDVYFVDVIGIRLAGGANVSSDEFKIQSSNDGFVWDDLLDLPIVDGFSRDYRAGGVSAQFIRLVRIGSTDLDTNKVQLAGLWIYGEGDVSQARLFDFGVSEQTSFVVALTDRSWTIYENDVLKTRLPSKFTNDVIPDVDSARSDFVFLFVQEDTPPQRLVYSIDTDLFTIDDIPFQSIPQFDYNDNNSPVPVSAVYNITFQGMDSGQLFKLRLESLETTEIVYAGGATTPTQGVADGIKLALEALPIVGAGGVSTNLSGSTVVVTFSASATDDFDIFEGYVTTGDFSDKVIVSKAVTGSPRKEDVWSETRGYPRTIAFYQNRLWFGGTKSKFQSLFASRVNFFFDFAINVTTDTSPIFVTLDSKRRNSITSLVSSRRLAIFTEGSEFVDSSEVVTPSTFAVNLQTSYGSRKINPVDVEGNIMFIDKDVGALRGFLYNFGEDAYSSNSLSTISSDLLKDPVDMGFSVGATGEDSIYVFIINGDGTCTVYNTLRAQEISNFVPLTTEGDFKAMVGIRDRVYLSVNRVIDGKSILTLERLTDDTYTDMNIKQDFGSPVTTVTGLDVLNGQECRVKADGYVAINATPVNGEIELDNEATVVEVGINYKAGFKFMPFSPNAGFSGLMRKKKVAEQNYMVFETQSFTIDGKKVVPTRTFGEGANSPLDKPPEKITGLVRRIEGQTGWSAILAPEIDIPDPTDFTLLAVETIVEVN